MPNSYVTFTGTGSQTIFSFAGIDDYLSTAYIKVYVNDILQTSGYTIDVTGANENVVFSTAPANGSTVKIARQTPSTSATFTANIVDFSDGSVLTASELDKGFKGLLHIVQEANDTGSGALGQTTDGLNWNAASKRLTNLSAGTEATDAVTKSQLDSVALFGVISVPQAWSFTGNGTTAFTLNPVPLSTDENMFIVEVGGIIQKPDSYTINSNNITFSVAPTSGTTITIRNFGVARNALDVLQNSSVTNQYMAADSVDTVNIINSAVTEAKLASNSVTNAKMADNSVNTSELVDGSVTEAKIGNLQVTTGKLANESVLTEKLANFSVTGIKIGNGSVSNDKLVSGSLNLANLATTQFTSNSGSNRFMKVDTAGTLSLSGYTDITQNIPTPTDATHAVSKSFLESASRIGAVAMLLVDTSGTITVQAPSASIFTQTPSNFASTRSTVGTWHGMIMWSRFEATGSGGVDTGPVNIVITTNAAPTYSASNTTWNLNNNKAFQVILVRVS
jgi:hypothetical protein